MTPRELEPVRFNFEVVITILFLWLVLAFMLFV